MPSGENRRHWTVAIFLQIALRLRYLWETALLTIPLFSGSLTAYKSPYRPKNCPTYDYFTHMGFKWIVLVIAFAREYGIFYVIYSYTGILSLIQWCHTKLGERLIAQFEKNGYTEAQREVPIPTYDWKKGTPEEFYNLFVKKPHPVILKGFMNKTDLLKELTWGKVLRKYGDEEVYLTRKDLDGYPGLLKEVDNPKVYLHNSEKLFNKYPEIKDLFQYERLESYLKMKVRSYYFLLLVFPVTGYVLPCDSTRTHILSSFSISFVPRRHLHANMALIFDEYVIQAGYEQIFVGKEGTGSPFHHAAVYNMFYMVDGSKQW